jgi:hypothetical protein
MFSEARFPQTIETAHDLNGSPFLKNNLEGDKNRAANHGYRSIGRPALVLRYLVPF